MSYLSGLEDGLVLCVPLLEPLSFSRLPFLSPDFSVWKQKREKLSITVIKKHAG